MKTTDKNFGTSGDNQLHSDKEYDIYSAEVIHIIMNSDDADYKGPKDIGKVYVKKVNIDSSKPPDAAICAYPYNPYQSMYPVRFENVLIFKAPSNLYGVLNNNEYYYLGILNAWGLNNHNALPYISGYKRLDEKSNGKGRFSNLPQKATSDKLIFGEHFKEKENVARLQPFEGDIMYSGRWGNYIRYGSSIKNVTPWQAKKDGEPIIYISTKSVSKDDFITEDIEKIDSCVIICSNQKLNFDPPTPSYKAYDTQPINPKQYMGNQIIISSDRLVLSSKKSDMLLYSDKSIGLFANSTINLQAAKNVIIQSDKNVYIKSNKCYLGNNPKHPMVHGDDLKNVLNSLLNAILKMTMTVTAPGSPTSTTINFAEFIKIKAQLQKIISTNNFLS